MYLMNLTRIWFSILEMNEILHLNIDNIRTKKLKLKVEVSVILMMSWMVIYNYNYGRNVKSFQIENEKYNIFAEYMTANPSSNLPADA